MKWFKHDADANMDAKLQEVLLDYGLEGYGLFWYCLELITNKVNSDNLTFELEHDARIIARNTGCSVQKVEEMMKKFVVLGLFENNCGVITCLKLADRLDKSMTNSPQMRVFIDSMRKRQHVMTLSDNVSPEGEGEGEGEGEYKKNSRQVDVNIDEILNIYQSVIKTNKPNWAECKSGLNSKRKALLKKSLTVVKKRAEFVGLSEMEYLLNLLDAMSKDPFYSGLQASRDKPNGYRWTLDQIFHEKQLTGAIDRLSGD